MKKMVTFAVMFAAVAILGTALTGAAFDETPASSEASAKSAKQCCQAKAAAVTQSDADTTTPKCCDQGKAKATVLAKTESSGGESCEAGKKATAGCALCGKDAVSKVADKVTVAATTVAETKVCADGQCPDLAAGNQGGAGKCSPAETTVLEFATDTAKNEDCAEENCKSDCGACSAAKLASTSAKAETQKCEFCKQECSSCADARKELAAVKTDVTAAPVSERGPASGIGHGPGMGHGHAGDSQHEKDHQDFFFLIEHRDSIRRTVKNLPNGIESLTESDDADVAEMIQVHVEAMYDRLESANPIRMRDPIFREVFANADKIKMEVEHTDKGVRVTETSTDAYAVKLMQEHAKVVSLWIKNGYAELPKNHAAPKR